MCCFSILVLSHDHGARASRNYRHGYKDTNITGEECRRKKQATVFIVPERETAVERRQAKPNTQASGGSRDDLDNHRNQGIQTCVPWACSNTGIAFITASTYEDILAELP